MKSKRSDSIDFMCWPRRKPVGGNQSSLAPLIALVLLLGTGFGVASASTWQHELTLENRWYLEDALDYQQVDTQGAVSWLGEYEQSWDGGDQTFIFKPFVRLDQKDNERNQVDIRELAWVQAGDDWELRIGIDKVFWGVTEAHHLVDTINQSDLSENIDGEEKLGQFMVKYSMERDWGTIDAYWLPWFRERKFPGAEGRLRTQPRVDTDQAQYDNNLEEFYSSVALRWSHSIGDWDIGVSHFHGTSREPRFTIGVDKHETVLVPNYDIVNRTSLDLQGAVGEWLWKLEALYESGRGESYAASTGGFEFTQVGFADTDADLGILFELMYDGRGDEATTPFNHDVFIGLRWVANDAQSSEVLVGMVQDWQSSGRFFNMEASRRLGDNWKASLEMRTWMDSDPDGLSYYQRNDDYIQISVVYYF